MDSRFPRAAASLAALLIGAALGCTPPESAEGPEAQSQAGVETEPQPGLETEEQKVLYSLGTQLATLSSDFALTEAELPTVQRGFVDQMLSKELAVDPAQYTEKIEVLLAARQEQAAAEERRLSEAWVEEAAKAENAVRHDEGFVITTFSKGTGEPLGDAEIATVRWKGKLRSGLLIGSSKGLSDIDTSDIQLDSSVRCWTLAVPKLRPSGKYKLMCPPDLVHGNAGLRPLIPGGAAVEYEIEVLKGQRFEDLLAPAPGSDAGQGDKP